ncbi:MAG: cytosine deaminase [Pseudomonadota bacterium]
MDFNTLPASGHFTMTNLLRPACFVGKSGTEFFQSTISIRDGRLVSDASDTVIDMGGAITMPCGVDMHTHIDKGHIWDRAPNPDGTFDGAINTVAQDRSNRWCAEDVRIRMEFSLRCAYAHGTRALRTHIDSIPPQDDISWPVFDSLRAEWSDRIDLQAACLVGIEGVSRDGPYAHTADLVKRYGGVLGAVAYPVADLADRLNAVFELAEARDLSVDFHVDETLDPGSSCLRAIAETVLSRGFQAPVTVGHCCSLGTQSPSTADRTLDLVAEAGLSVVSLPLCNLYLQDRQAGRTPRFRGITLVHEMFARGIAVAFASDNTRDPFYAYGDLDMLEVMREATRIGHLDHSHGEWPMSFSVVPADICGFSPCSTQNEPADMIIYNARSWTELFARPQSDRIVLRNGRQIDRTLPDYRELDPLMEPA